MSAPAQQKLLAKAAAKNKPYDALDASRCTHAYHDGREIIVLPRKDGKLESALLIASNRAHDQRKQSVRECKGEGRIAENSKTAAQEKASTRQLDESAFHAARPKNADSLALPASYRFRHAVDHYGFAGSLQEATTRKYPRSNAARVRAYGLMQREQEGPLESGIELHVEPEGGDWCDCRRCLLSGLYSTMHKPAAKWLAKKRSAKKLASKTKRRT